MLNDTPFYPIEVVIYMNLVGTNRVHYKGITGLKFIALTLMFLWHAPIQRPPVDLGARLCEFFFCISGFLFFFSRSQMDTSVTSIAKYMKKKIVSMWPAHFVGFIAALFLIPLDQWTLPKTWINAVLNLTLMQSWVNSEYVFWGFNGVSWYLSSLLFCYLSGFLVLKLIKRIDYRLLFVILFTIRYMLEAIPNAYPGEFWNINIHISPLASSLEFSEGMLAAVFFEQVCLPRSQNLTLAVASMLELLCLFATIWLLIMVEGKWLRATYTPLFCVLILCFSFDKGILSRLFSAKFVQWLSKFQLEIYMFHVLCFQLIKYTHPLPIQMVIYIVALVLSIAFFRLFFRQVLVNIVDRFCVAFEIMIFQKKY